MKKFKAWQDQLMFPPEGECKINICEATTCEHNKNKKCTKEVVDVFPNGKCKSYTGE